MSERHIENIAKADSNFAPTFVDRYLLSDINFNGHCLINKNVFITENNESIHFLHIKSMVKKIKHRFYIK